MNRRLLQVLLCALLLGLTSVPAWAIARPENRVGKIFSGPSKSAFAAPDQPLERRGENPSCGYDFASGVHKYLYAEDDPVDGSDPSGHLGLFKFTREFGNWARRVIEDEYQAEHPGAICGTTTGILGTGLKPDIFDGPNRVYMEIKPLSLSGVAKGIVQIATYDAAFTAFNLDYSRGTWPNGVRQSNVGSVPIVYFNVQGVIFYTDYTDNLDDMVGISTFALARQFIISNSALMARTLVPSLVRISQIIEVSIPAMEVDAAPVGEF